MAEACDKKRASVIFYAIGNCVLLHKHFHKLITRNSKNAELWRIISKYKEADCKNPYE